MSKIKISYLLSMMLLVSSFDLAYAKKAKTKKERTQEKHTEESEPQEKKAAKKWSRPYGMAGCGLGSVVMGKGGGQISAVTTNGTFSNQMLGITFEAEGLNCVNPPMGDLASQMDQFINVNKSMVFVDMVKGKGENLNALALMLDCQNSNSFSKSLKGNFSTIYNRGQSSTMEITDTIITVLLNDPEQAGACKALSTLG